jgi:hypothetical protein
MLFASVYINNAPTPSAKAATTTPAFATFASAPLTLLAEPDAAEPEEVAVPFPDVDSLPTFSSSTPPTPVAFLHESPESSWAVDVNVTSAH